MRNYLKHINFSNTYLRWKLQKCLFFFPLKFPKNVLEPSRECMHQDLVKKTFYCKVTRSENLVLMKSLHNLPCNIRNVLVNNDYLCCRAQLMRISITGETKQLRIYRLNLLVIVLMTPSKQNLFLALSETF